MIYRAKMPRWALGVAIAGQFLFLISFLSMVWLADNLNSLFWVSVPLAVMEMMFLLMFFWTRYEVTSSALVCRLGPFRFRVPFNDLVEVAPAWSQNDPSVMRVAFRWKTGEITYGRFSQQQGEAFLEELRNASPWLGTTRDELARPQ